MTEGFALSPQQKRLWSLIDDRTDMPVAAQVTIGLTGTLDRDRLISALEQVVAQNEILHTQFKVFPGMHLPLQVVGTPAVAWSPDENLKAMEPDTHQQRLQALRESLAKPAFDLATGPMIRAQLVALDAKNHVLLICLSIFQADVATLQHLCAAIAARYQGLPTEAEEVQFIETSEWLHEFLDSEDAQAGFTYWQDAREIEHIGMPKGLQVGHREKTVATATFTGNHLSPELSAKLEDQAEQLESSPVGLAFAAWQAFTFLLNDREPIAIAAAFDGRTDDSLANAMGPMTFYVPVAIPLSGDMSFAEVVTGLSQHTESLYPHLECFNWDSLQTSADSAAFASIGFAYQTQASEVAAAGVSFKTLAATAWSDRVDLQLTLQLPEDGFRCQFDYNSQVVSAQRVQQLAGDFTRFLERLLTQPRRPLKLITLLLPEARDAAYAAMHQPRSESLGSLDLNAAFETWAATTPNHAALEFEDTVLGYRQLNDRANRLAHHLLHLGVGSETVVGICLERGIQAYVSILAVLKAGATYLPLDPTYPASRLSYMVEDSQTRFIVSQADHENLFESTDAIIIDMDTVEAATLPVPNIATKTHPQSLAYLIYTSGTTGKPKGTGISYGSLHDHIQNTGAFFEIVPEDRILQFAAFNFDPSLEQMLVAWLNGATLVSRDRDMWDPAALPHHFSRLQLTVVNLPTAYWHLAFNAWQEADTTVENPQLRLVIGGGEAMHPGHAATWTNGPFGHARLLNGYGPTEATVSASFGEIRNLTLENSHHVSIGQPLPGRFMFAVDNNGEALPFGFAGELQIGGDSLARGYWKRPGLTATTFIPDGLSGRRGARLYRTGDHVRIHTPQVVHFLGRRDQQIKLRGFRVELSEIEAAVSTLDGVGEAAAALFSLSESDPRLVAYAVPLAGQKIDTQSWREHLTKLLPGYMIPNQLMVCESLPKLPNGKMDRASLPEPDSTPADTQSAAGATPRPGLESQIAQIWRELLHVSELGRHDDFFDLGGHSLVAMQFVRRLRKDLEVDYPLTEFFTSPNLADQAAKISKYMVEGSSEPGVKLEPQPRTGALPLSQAQLRMWLAHQRSPNSSGYHVPFAVKLRGYFQQELFERALQALVARHEVLRTTFELVGDAPSQTIRNDLPFTSEHIDLSLLEGDAQNEALMTAGKIFLEDPFDLAHELPGRACFIKLDPDTHIALFVLHHIVSDGWSVGILIRELGALYGAMQTDEPAELPPLDIQYADYAIWERAWLTPERLAMETDYWANALGGMTKTQKLPLATAPPVYRLGQAIPVNFSIPAATAAGLRELAHRHQATFFMVLLSAFEAVIHAFTEEEDMVIGTDVANRNRAELESLIGFFVNQLVLRTSFSGMTQFGELLERVRKTCLDGISHQHLPFDRVVEVVNPDRTSQRAPLFQRKFVLQNIEKSTLTLGDLELSPFSLGTTRAKWDLLLDIEDGTGDLRGNLFFNDAVYEQATVERLTGHFLWLLEQITRVADISLATLKNGILEREKADQAEQHRQLQAMNQAKFKNLRRSARV